METTVNSISILVAAQKSYNKANRLFRELKELTSLSREEKKERQFDVFVNEILGVVKGDFVHITHYKGRVISLDINNQSVFSIDITDGKIYSFEFVGFEFEFKNPIEHNRELSDYDFFVDLIGQAISQG